MIPIKTESAWRGTADCRACGIREEMLFADLHDEDFDLIHTPIDDLEYAPGQPLVRAGDTATGGIGRTSAQAEPGAPAGRRGRQQFALDPVQFAQRRMLRRIVAPASAGGAFGIGLRRQAWRGVPAHASGGHAFTSCWIAPRRSISLRWKKWLVSCMRTSCGLRGRVSIQS